MQMPLISIIVPVYNTAPWLRRCLDSICAQTYQNLEILCVNDGSTDNSAEILAEYAAKDSRIKVITQENAGLSAARNTALAHATGEWVTGVDSDDYLAPGGYERAVACITGAVDMVFFGVRKVTEDEMPLPHDVYFDLPDPGEYKMTPNLAEQLNVCFWSKLWRRSLLEENNLRFPHGLVHEDEAMYYLSAPYVRKVAFSSAVGYYYVQRSSSIMHSSGSVLDSAWAYVAVLEFVRKHLNPVHSAYYVLMLWRLYKQCFRYSPREKREQLASVFRTMVPADASVEDYRIHCLVQKDSRWVRYEPSRLVYCLIGVPILARKFDGFNFYGWQFAMWRVLRAFFSR